MVNTERSYRLTQSPGVNTVYDTVFVFHMYNLIPSFVLGLFPLFHSYGLFLESSKEGSLGFGSEQLKSK